MKTILVTTDLSQESTTAFKLALELAAKFNSQIILLAVIEDLSQAAVVYAMDFPVLPDPEVQKQVVERVKRELAQIHQKHFSAVKCEAIVREARGPVHTEILKTAQEHQAELIVIATHGRTGLSRLLIGSVTERVVREAKCPVLTVPSPAPAS